MDDRFFISKLENNIASFNAVESNHICKVRRKQVGDKIMGFTGDGFDYFLEITDLNKNAVKARVLNKQQNAAFLQPETTVYLAMLKNDALTTAIDNLAQTNVKTVKLFKSDFSIANIDAKKLEKLNSISVQASKQCERADIMQIEIIKKQDIKKDIMQHKNRFFAYENATEKPAPFSGSFAVIIGAEGGFSPEEVEYFSSFAKPISLGKTIMRAPVACVSAISSLKVLNK